MSIQRGLFHEKRNEFNEAKQCYQNAVTVHPAHLKSLQHLVITSIFILHSDFLSRYF